MFSVPSHQACLGLSVPGYLRCLWGGDRPLSGGNGGLQDDVLLKRVFTHLQFYGFYRDVELPFSKL